jgi:hypothetical protein
VTTVFRLMAPTKINMARRITVSLRDIVECLRGMYNPGGTLSTNTPMSSSPKGKLVTDSVQGTWLGTFAPEWASRPVAQYRYLDRLRAAPLYEQQYGGTKLLSTGHALQPIPRPANSLPTAKFPGRLDASSAVSVALMVRPRRRSSVAERGSHNP